MAINEKEFIIRKNFGINQNQNRFVNQPRQEIQEILNNNTLRNIENSKFNITETLNRQIKITTGKTKEFRDPQIVLTNFSITTTSGTVLVNWGDNTTNVLESGVPITKTFYCPFNSTSEGFWNNISPCL